MPTVVDGQILYATLWNAQDARIAVLEGGGGGGGSPFAPWVNVMDHGAIGDGVANDTTAIQAAITVCAAAGGGVVFFPAGIYKITGALIPDTNKITFMGVGRDVSIIRQATANTPVFKWTNSLSCLARDIHFEHLTLEHVNAPGAGTTQQYGIQFRSDAAGTLYDICGFYLCSFHDLTIRNSYIGIGPYSTGGGACPIWGSSFRDLWFHDTYWSPLALIDTTPAGAPSNSFRDIHILNYTLESSATNPGALYLSAQLGMVLDNINVEDWQGYVLNVAGNATATAIINGLRTERHDMRGAYPIALNLNNGTYILNGVDLKLRTHDTGWSRGVMVSAGADVVINGLTVARYTDGTSTTNNAIELLSGDPATSTIQVNGMQIDGASNVAEYFVSGFGTPLYTRKRVDGLPPKVDALPTAAVRYRGREFTVEGGTGVADVTSRCVKNSSNVYVWVAI